MKKYVIPFSIITFLFFHILSFAQGDLGRWMYYKEIDAHEQNEYKSFFLDEEIYKHSKKDLGDIRIINEKNEFVPYYVSNEYLSKQEETKVKYDAKEIISFIKDRNQYTDFEIIHIKDDEDILGNQLAFEINQDHFMKNVVVYGGYDSNKWEYIKNDYIYKTDTEEKLSINLDKFYKYDYYRIVFVNDIENTYIKELKLVFDEKKVVYESYQKEENIEFEERLEGRYTTILIDNNERLRINNIKINSKDDFKREYKLFLKNDNSKFKIAKSGEIHKVNLKDLHIEKNYIKIDNKTQAPDIIKIQINNQDNNPISIEDIVISYYTDKVVFKGTKGKYKILFYNKLISKPYYDIESYKNHIEKEDQEICELSKIYKQENNTALDDQDVNYKWILNIIIIVISISMILLIKRKSRSKDLE